jgi:chromosome segregation ATPase
MITRWLTITTSPSTTACTRSSDDPRYSSMPRTTKRALVAEKGEGDISYKSVFTEIEGESRPQLLDQNPLDEPVFAEGDEYLVKPDKEVRPVPKYSRRARLADEFARGDHPAFRRNIANRLWAWMMGRGLVEPVDLHHSGNPAEHAEVLQLMGDALAEQDFDLREILRELAQTKVYQRSVEPDFDWLEQVRRGAEQRAEVEALREAVTQQRDEAIQAHDALRATVRSLQSEIAPLEQAFREARQTEAKVAFELREATTKLTATTDQLASRESILAAVQAAATAAQQAATALPDETELATATAQFVKKADALASEVAELGKSLEEHQPLVTAAETSHLTAKQTLQEAEQAYQTAASPLREQEAELKQLANELERRQQRRQVVDRQLARLRTLESRQETLLEQLALQEQLEQLAAARAEIQRMLEPTSEPRVAALGDKESVAVILQDEETENAQQESVDSDSSERDDPAPSEGIDAGNHEGAVEAIETELELESASSDNSDPGELQRKLAELDAQKLELEARLVELTPAVQVARQELEDVWTRQLALAPLKTLSPEQLAWSVLEATGVVAAHRRAVEKELDEKAEAEPLEGAARATAIERGVHAKLQSNVVQFVRLFGAGEGQPQYDFFATVDQALFLTNGGPIQSWLKPSGDNLTQRLMMLDAPEAIADELYLTILSRLPDADERQWVAEAIGSDPEAKSDLVQELAWALLTSAEFRFCP